MEERAPLGFAGSRVTQLLLTRLTERRQLRQHQGSFNHPALVNAIVALANATVALAASFLPPEFAI